MNDKQQVIGGAILFVVFATICAILFFPQPYHASIESLEWRTVTEIEEFMQVHIERSKHRPPEDAYNVVRGKKCTTNYDSQNDKIETDCDTVYSYDIDRYVHVSDVVQSGMDRNPVFSPYELVHFERYGNQRAGNQRIEYYATLSIGKRCKINEKFWLHVEPGQRVIGIRTIALGHLCKLSY